MPQKQGKAAGRHATLPSRGSPRQETLEKRSNKCEQAGRRGKFRRERCIDPRPPFPPGGRHPVFGRSGCHGNRCRRLHPPHHASSHHWARGAASPDVPATSRGHVVRRLAPRRDGRPSTLPSTSPPPPPPHSVPSIPRRVLTPSSLFFFFTRAYISPPPSRSLSLCLRRRRVFDASGYPKMAARSRGERPAAAKTFFVQVPDITTRLPSSSPQKDAPKLWNTPAPTAVSVPGTRRLGARITSSIPTNPHGASVLPASGNNCPFTLGQRPFRKAQRPQAVTPQFISEGLEHYDSSSPHDVESIKALRSAVAARLLRVNYYGMKGSSKSRMALPEPSFALRTPEQRPPLQERPVRARITSCSCCSAGCRRACLDGGVPPGGQVRATPVRGRRKSSHLGQLLAVVVRQEGAQRLEAGVDALHPPTLVAVGDLSPDSLLLLHLRLGTRGPVAEAAAATGKRPTSNKPQARARRRNGNHSTLKCGPEPHFSPIPVAAGVEWKLRK